MATVDFVNIEKSFGALRVIKQMSLRIEDKQFVTLLGPSGCGKTTMLRMLAGFLSPDQGEIRIDGEVVNEMPPERRPTAMVFQNYALWPHMKVFDNVGFGLQIRRLPKKEVQRRVEKVLELVNLGGLGDRYPRQLSGGQQQRVSMARALVLEPKILLLDEPLSNLDAKLRERMRSELRRIQKALEITTVYVTHDQEEAMTMSDTMVVLYDGVVQQIGAPKDVYSNPQTEFVAFFIGSTNVFEGRIVQENGGYVARLGDHTIPIDSICGEDVEKYANGSPVKLAVRSEDVELSSHQLKDTLPGKVIDSSYVGQYIKVFVDVSGVGEVQINLPKNIEAQEAGKDIYVKFHDMKIFKGNDE